MRSNKQLRISNKRYKLLSTKLKQMNKLLRISNKRLQNSIKTMYGGSRSCMDSINNPKPNIFPGTTKFRHECCNISKNKSDRCARVN